MVSKLAQLAQNLAALMDVFLNKNLRHNPSVLFRGRFLTFMLIFGIFLMIFFMGNYGTQFWYLYVFSISTSLIALALLKFRSNLTIPAVIFILGFTITQIFAFQIEQSLLSTTFLWPGPLLLATVLYLGMLPTFFVGITFGLYLFIYINYFHVNSFVYPTGWTVEQYAHTYVSECIVMTLFVVCIGFIYETIKTALIKNLEDSNAKLRNLMQLVAHDLKTPLSAIAGLTELLELSLISDTEKQRDIIRRLRRLSLYSVNLVSETMDAAILSDLKLHLKRVNIHGVLNEAIFTCQHLADSKDITLKLVSEPGVYARADEVRLLQVLTNLISNAIKFSLRKHTVEIKCTVQDQIITLSVTDTGIGIAPDLIPLVFEKASLIKNRKGTEGEASTGYGLFISQEIMKAQGSEITVHSQPAKGSTFSFVLPVEGKKS